MGWTGGWKKRAIPTAQLGISWGQHPSSCLSTTTSPLTPRTDSCPRGDAGSECPGPRSGKSLQNHICCSHTPPVPPSCGQDAPRTSQRHPGKFPKVPGRRRGTRGFPAAPRQSLYASFRRRQWHPIPVLLPGKSHERRSLVGCSPWGHQELDTTERLPFHFSLSCIGEGNGNPLQCSCLENPRDRGAWDRRVRPRLL